MVLVIAAAFVAGTLTTATIVTAQGDTITACVNDKSQGKDLRIVDSPDDCRNNESVLQWNTEGPQGETGPAGASSIANGVQVSGSVAVGSTVLLTAACPIGDLPIGKVWTTGTPGNRQPLAEEFEGRNTNFDGSQNWVWQVKNIGTATTTVKMSAICFTP